ncbi:hypothetical protein SUDANB121_04788 [Nocardiopsis dassonvillei]|uniref:SRPBCC family protein n=1 Tax=Nocardiopsis dassonvillei TaxID=2014 RepID=UPI003F568778
MITETRRIDADRVSVWRVLSDLDRWAEMLPTIDGISRVGADSGPITVGTRFRVRQPGPVPTAVYRVTEWRPEHGFTWEARGTGIRAVATHVLGDAGTGTELRLGITWTGPLARPVRALLSRTARAYLASESATLASIAERR